MIMERTEVLGLMSELKLFGMRNAYDEILATALKRQHEPQRFAGDLLKAEICEKQARSIKYQLTIAKLPLAKDIDGFEFTAIPINESLVRDLAGGSFIAQQRNIVLVGGTGTGKTHLAMAIARSLDRLFGVQAAPDHAAGSSTPSIWSTGSKPKDGPVARDGSPITSRASTSSFSMNSAICRLPRPADSACFIWSAGSTSGPR
jgi:hypothetical protein